MIKNFAIFQNTNKENEKQPDYKMSVKIGDKFVDAGVGWKRTSEKGVVYLSMKLSDPWEKEYEGVKKSGPGFYLAEESKSEDTAMDQALKDF